MKILPRMINDNRLSTRNLMESSSFYINLAHGFIISVCPAVSDIFQTALIWGSQKSKGWVSEGNILSVFKQIFCFILKIHLDTFTAQILGKKNLVLYLSQGC